MPILNYTTEVEATKTVGEIQRILARHGAKAVMQEFDDEGEVISLAFRLDYQNQVISFRMPARIEKIYVALQNDPKVPPRYCKMAQARRVGWRIVKDWVEAQLALVETEMVELAEVFLPYAQTDNGDTVFERLRSQEFRSLTYDGDTRE